MRVLLVKMSSLGDVVHALPAVTDAADRGIRFHWVVEEAFADIPGLHPAIDRVLPIAWRRWRQGLTVAGREIGSFVRQLRQEPYDLVLDAQGLIKSAVVSALARTRERAGFGFTSAREPWSAFVCNRRVRVPKAAHAIDRQRALFAHALGYPVPVGKPSFGLVRQTAGRASRRCILLHGTTWESKHYPLSLWRSLAGRLVERGFEVELPWGSADEQQRAVALAEGVVGVRVLPAMPLAEIGLRLASARLVIGVDSGLAHLAAATGVPTIVVYGSTDPRRTGVRGPRVENLASTLACAPCLSRRCRYRGESVLWQGEQVNPPCYALVPPERILDAATRLLREQI